MKKNKITLESHGFFSNRQIIYKENIWLSSHSHDTSQMDQWIRNFLFVRLLNSKKKDKTQQKERKSSGKQKLKGKFKKLKMKRNLPQILLIFRERIEKRNFF